MLLDVDTSHNLDFKSIEKYKRKKESKNQRFTWKDCYTAGREKGSSLQARKQCTTYSEEIRNDDIKAKFNNCSFSQTSHFGTFGSLYCGGSWQTTPTIVFILNLVEKKGHIRSEQNQDAEPTTLEEDASETQQRKKDYEKDERFVVIIEHLLLCVVRQPLSAKHL